MDRKLELLIKKNTLKSIELWLYEQYDEIDRELNQIAKEEE